MRATWLVGVAVALAIGGTAGAAEIRLAEQFSMGYLQFNVMKRDRLIEKYAAQRGLKDFRVSTAVEAEPCGCLRRADQNADAEHDHAAEHDLEHGLKERRVHVFRADEGDRP